MPTLRPLAAALVLGSAIASARATAQDAGPLALVLPISARPAALGNAWVAGRDEYAVFSNPALATATTGFGFTFAQYGGASRALAATSGVTVGPATLAWGVHVVDFSRALTDTTYPFAPAALTGSGSADVFSMVALAAGRIVWKNFNIGLAGKYAEDVAPTRGSTVLLDVGTSHALLSGTAGLAVQNIAPRYELGTRETDVPLQAALGWTRTRTLGPLDAGIASQVMLRQRGWVGYGGGLDVSWGWIEGYSIGGRVGARRTETDAERPVAVGATFNADRLNVEYALGFFAGATYSHRMTLRWR